MSGGGRSRLSETALLATIYAGALFVGYWLWVYGSYLAVPFQAPPYVIQEKIVRAPGGYPKLVPGVYRNDRYGIDYRIGSRGFRGPEFSARKSAGVRRYIALGASSTLGLESPDDRTWPSRLQRLLGRAGRVEVINAGVGGTSSKDHLAMLRGELLDYGPDAILYYEGRNDHAYSGFERYPGPALYPAGRLAFLGDWKALKAIQARFLLRRWFGREIDPADPPAAGSWQGVYAENLRAMIRASRARGVPFIIVTQALDYPVGALEALSRGDRRGAFERLSMRDGSWVELMRHLDVLRFQASAASETRQPLIDVYKDVYDAKERGAVLFFDQVHLTPEGNEVLAGAIARGLDAVPITHRGEHEH